MFQCWESQQEERCQVLGIQLYRHSDPCYWQVLESRHCGVNPWRGYLNEDVFPGVHFESCLHILGWSFLSSGLKHACRQNDSFRHPYVSPTYKLCVCSVRRPTCSSLPSFLIKNKSRTHGHHTSVKHSTPETGKSMSQGMTWVNKANVQVAVARFSIWFVFILVFITHYDLSVLCLTLKIQGCTRQPLPSSCSHSNGGRQIKTSEQTK